MNEIEVDVRKSFIELIDDIPKPVSIAIGIDLLLFFIFLPIVPIISTVFLIGIITVMVV